MSALTDDFDMALQVTEETIQRVVQARYKVGIINHKYIRNYYDKRVNLVINCPQVILTTSTGSDQLAIVTSRVFYNSRALNDNKDVGRDAVADVSARANFKLSSGDPGRLSPDTRLIVDFSETQKDDIVVHDAPNDLENEVKDMLLEFIGYGGGSFQIPPIGSSSYRVGNLAFRFNANTNKRFIVVGMNIGDTIKGSKDGLIVEFVQNDWSLALSDKYFLSKLRDRLRQSFPLPYKITRKCTGRSPLGNCLNWMTVNMTSLNINLYDGKIKIDGKFKIINSFFLDANASFEAFVTLSFGANQSLEVSIGEINVSIGNWWADAANFISGNQFKDQIRIGIMSALQSVSAGSVTNFFTFEILASLGSISRRSLEIELQAKHITIRPDAVIIHGNLITPQLDTPPIAAITVIGVTETPLHKILHAGESWAPNGTITNYYWEHSDGTSETYYDRHAKFVIDHVYNNKDWHTCLTVTDNLGRKTKICNIQPYKPQYCPGSTIIAENRRRIMMGCIVKIMDLPYIDVIDILGHRASGRDYPSIHPPLAEMGEPDCPIREIVTPTPGTAAGDRVRYVQWVDSMYNAPLTPYWRSYHAAIHYRGVDLVSSSGRQIIEARERDVEAIAKEQLETNMFSSGLSAMRGCTVHGHSLRLQEDGVMFDMLDRCRLEGNSIVQDKNQVGIPIDRKVNLGKPISKAEAAKGTTIYRVDNVPFRSDKEVIEHVQRIWELRTKYGFQPKG